MAQDAETESLANELMAQHDQKLRNAVLAALAALKVDASEDQTKIAVDAALEAYKQPVML